MDQVIPNLWIGDIVSALNKALLDRHRIKYVLSAMRGDLAIDPRLIQYQIPLDDTETSDILTHFPPSIAFIRTAIETGSGVLVHCHAGMSRSATIVTAYLMHSQSIGVNTALTLLRAARPIVCPNDAFLAQLKLFHDASNKVSADDKATRKYYLERTVQELLKNSGNKPSPIMLASLPASQSSDGPLCRKIRCKMCRCELATREHMLGHGVSRASPIQLTTASNSPPLQGITPNTPPSAVTSQSSHNEKEQPALGDTSSSSSLGPLRAARESAAEMTRITATGDVPAHDLKDDPPGAGGALANESSVDQLSKVLAMTTVGTGRDSTNEGAINEPALRKGVSSRQVSKPGSSLPRTAPINGGVLAALKSPAPLQPPSPPGKLSSAGSTTPLLENSKCSGYFVEPMKWMDFFLENGEVAGKIVCPNKRCGAKLGNYDWAGVGCSCKEWVTPGFCIHKSKVDEIW